MTCLSHEQLVALALKQSDDAVIAEHLAGCASCQSKLESVRSVLLQLGQLHKKSAEQHRASRASLLEQIAQEEPEPETAIFRRATRWIGELTMRQRLALLTASLTPVLGFVVLWISLSSTPAIAMEEMAKKIREAKSYQMNFVQEFKRPISPIGKDGSFTIRSKMFWKSPDTYRMETEAVPESGIPANIEIVSESREGLTILPDKKQYLRVPARRGHRSPLMYLHKLGEYRGDAERDLGTKEINSIRCIGFEIDSKKLDPSAKLGMMQVWMDAESKLPVLIIYEVLSGASDVEVRMENIRWNIDLDPELFSTVPPKGYTDITPPAKTADELVKYIQAGLSVYAEYSDGEYPRVKMVYGDTTRDDLLKKMGFDRVPTRKEVMSEKYRSAHEATRGFGTINVIQRENPDAVWNGLTVTSKDADKILFRWKLDDGTYQVIYGDLKSENVTAAKLQQLEAK